MEKRTYPYKEPSDFQKIKDIIEHQLGVKESDLLLTSNICLSICFLFYVFSHKNTQF